ncbi:MAG: DMT family transporter [Candidatus Eisenbacteria bacterium]
MARTAFAPLLICLLAAFLFGSSTPIAKALLEYLAPWTLSGFLYLGGALGVLPFALSGGRPRLTSADRWRLAGAVVFGGVLGPVLMLGALRAAPAGGIALLLNLETVATTLLAVAFFREHVDRRSLAALGLILLAGVLLAGPAGGVSLRAFVGIALACACWGLDNNWTATIAGLTPARTTLVKGVVAGCTSLLIGLALEPRSGAIGVAGTSVLLALAVGAFAYGASIALYIRGAQQLGASRSQLVFSTAPFFGLLVATIGWGEPLTPALLVCGLLMAAGVALLSTARHVHEHAHEALEHTHRHRHDDGHHDHVHPDLPPHHAHTHAHHHGPQRHAHPHAPDLHHRHAHDEPMRT